jgi:RES domain-containing protein
MIVYRLSNAAYSKDISGEGAYRYGGRWNSVGERMLYTASSPSLALVESMVHFPSEIPPIQFMLISIEIPDAWICIQNIKTLPEDWQSYPAPFSLREIGDNFLSSNSFLTMQVPSAIVPQEKNYLINPLHPKFKMVKVLTIEPFILDSRIFTRN